MHMNDEEKIINNVLLLLLTYFAIGFLWQALEMVFYGEIQPRKVDDIIGIVWVACIVKAYYRGLRHGKKTR